MSALPLRLKLTLAFAIAMAAVLAAMGVFVYVRVGSALSASVDHNLRAQVAETASHVQRGRDLVDPDTAGGPVLAQLLNASGVVVRSTPAGVAPLINRATARRIDAGAHLLRTADLHGRRGEWRLFAVPLTVAGRTLVLIVAGSLATRQEALHRLFAELLVAGPIALLLAALAGYGLAAAALRPVEAMRRRAAEISAATPGRRLPVPAGRDEIARLAATMNEMLSRLETAFEHERSAIEHERRFIADASHELRTPLALLRTELDVALRRPRPRQELEAALRSAAEETERLTRLAADLLLIARSDQGHLSIRREQVTADELLQTAADRFAVRAREDERTIVVSDSQGLIVDADAVRLEQALGNLIDNALTHGAGAIQLSAVPRGRAVELHVTDEGPGLPASFVPRAFDRFSRADEARGRGGTGLGLSIVDLIARAHGGEAGARNRPSGGADVWIAVERVDTARAVSDATSATVGRH